MSRLKRPESEAEASRRNREQLARAGGQLRTSRKRRRITPAQLGAAIFVTQSTISLMERGLGGSLSMDVWQRAFAALDRSIVIEVSRDPLEEPADAGHLRIQELVLRLARRAGIRATFELPTGSAAASTDVGLRDDRHRVPELIECWNVIGDVGAGARSTARKVADAEMVAIPIGGERPYRVVLGRTGDSQEPRAPRPISGNLRPTLSGFFGRLGGRLDGGRGASRSAWNRVVRFRVHTALSLAADRPASGMSHSESCPFMPRARGRLRRNP